jgi:hypothetical protein
MAIILKANTVNLLVSSVLFVFWYHSPNFLDAPHIVDNSYLFSEYSTKVQRMRVCVCMGVGG